MRKVRKRNEGKLEKLLRLTHICPECEAKEQRHPDYQKAGEAEAEAIRRGHVMFPGIGSRTTRRRPALTTADLPMSTPQQFLWTASEWKYCNTQQ